MQKKKIGLAEFSKKVAEATGSNAAQTKKILKAAMDQIVKEVQMGNTVTLVGFARFEEKEFPARTYKVPGSGKEVKVGARKRLHAKVSPALTW